MATKRLTGSNTEEVSVSDSDWPVKKPQLKNLQLLKQYLTFVSHETKTSINTQDKSIQFSFEETVEKQDQTSRLGAAIIETMVHDDKKQTANQGRPLPNMANRATDRRRPGRPPKPKMFFDDEQAMYNNNNNNNKPKLIRQKKRDIIQCICDAPQDEFGGMIQCDDCFSWLHVECLELDENALEDSYRCPPCCVSIGKPSQQNMSSSMTWRYEAQLKSQRLAAIQETSDDDDDDEEEETLMDCDVAEQPLAMNVKLPIRIDTSINYNVEEAPISSRSATPEDWSDVSSESRYSTSSCSTSEVSTPKEQMYVGDPFEYQQGNLAIDPESFELLSRLAYLQKLKDDLFSPSATDVFLCEKTSPYSLLQPEPLSQSTSLYETLPSTICSQELSEFSFDNGPFWKPLN
ncbi:hypothetical protein G6F56_009135 [Rhizopus delemar]|nr:hypothetical protein G6F56_009135 [Rhizopus delemar]